VDDNSGQRRLPRHHRVSRCRVLLRTCALAALCVLGACAPQANLPQVDAGQVDAEARIQQEMVLRSSVDILDRLDRVGWNIRASSADLCGDTVAYSLGLNFLELDDYAKEKRDIAQHVLGVHWRPTVFQAAPGGPADKAGLRRGDVVAAVAGKKVTDKKHLNESLSELIKTGDPVEMTVERGGAPLTFTLTPAKLCFYPVILSPSADVNAFANGTNITVCTGMMKFVKSDDELAAVVGHEMAHNTQRHIRSKQVNALIGQVLLDLPMILLTGYNPGVGQNIGASMFSPEYEAEADYVGLYYTARAGYDIHNVADVWRRMSIENPKGISMVTTHPSNSQRFVALAADAAEIDRKRAEGRELKPEMKGGAKPAPQNAAPPQAESQKPGGQAAATAAEQTAGEATGQAAAPLPTGQAATQAAGQSTGQSTGN